MYIYTQYIRKYHADPAKSVAEMDAVLNRLATTETYEDPNEPYRFAEFSKEELVAALVTASYAVARYLELLREHNLKQEAKRNREEDNNNPYYEQQ